MEKCRYRSLKVTGRVAYKLDSTDIGMLEREMESASEKEEGETSRLVTRDIVVCSDPPLSMIS
jgi:hypothetical protein